jgi:hypothetical protein
MIDTILLSAIIGAILGIVSSVFFGIYSKPTLNASIYSVFGMNSDTLIASAILMVVVCGMIILSCFSFIVRDLAYPIANPLKFTTEVLMMGILPTLVFPVMLYFRGIPYSNSHLMEGLLLMAKFGLLHVLLQISGFYSAML